MLGFLFSWASFEVLALKRQLLLWSHVLLQLLPVMGASCGTPAAPIGGYSSRTFHSRPLFMLAFLAALQRCRRHLPNGQLASVVEGKCISTSGDLVVMAACDDASAWEAQGNGDRYFAALLAACCLPARNHGRSIEARWRRPEVFEPAGCFTWCRRRCSTWCVMYSFCCL